MLDGSRCDGTAMMIKHDLHAEDLPGAYSPVPVMAQSSFDLQTQAGLKGHRPIAAPEAGAAGS